MSDISTERKTIRIAGRLKEIITLRDNKGKIIQRIMQPIMVEFYPRDLMQVIIGASLLAIPVAFTEETWKLGESLPFINTLTLMLLSIVFISAFVYYNYYRNELKQHKSEFIKRVILTYLAAFLVVSFILVIIQRAPWSTDWILALKRTILVTFPACMSGAVADMIK